jgi:hypothetical protein
MVKRISQSPVIVRHRCVTPRKWGILRSEMDIDRSNRGDQAISRICYKSVMTVLWVVDAGHLKESIIPAKANEMPPERRSDTLTSVVFLVQISSVVRTCRSGCLMWSWCVSPGA